MLSRDVLAYRVAFEAMYAAFSLFQVHRIWWEIPMNNFVAVCVKVEAFLSDGGRCENKWPEWGIERAPNIIGTNVVSCLI
jgi:hypothetical protein